MYHDIYDTCAKPQGLIPIIFTWFSKNTMVLCGIATDAFFGF